MKTTAMVEVLSVTGITCDRCGFSAETGEPEAGEFLSHRDVGGYGSIFGDGASVAIDLCQRCIKDLLGKWIRVGTPGTYAEATEGLA
jgi:hypothetical protein